MEREGAYGLYSGRGCPVLSPKKERKRMLRTGQTIGGCMLSLTSLFTGLGLEEGLWKGKRIGKVLRGSPWKLLPAGLPWLMLGLSLMSFLSVPGGAEPYVLPLGSWWGSALRSTHTS